jgi:hypothetical protein
MNLANKTFKDNRTGEVIRVIDSFDNIAILENKQKMDVSKIIDTNLYTEQIDPNTFFSNQGSYNILADKIKSISTENIIDDDSESISINVSDTSLKPASSESAVFMSSEDDERAELARKYGVVDNISSINKQNEAFAKLLEDSDVQVTENVKAKPFENNLQQKSVEVTTNIKIDTEDPIIKMFKGVKRNVEFKMNVEISNRIPRIDFIEMMEDSYETSIIDFLADEFTNNLLNNPDIIRNMIKDKIKLIVYGAEVTKKVEEVITSEPKQLVNQASKKRATRRTKKETQEND